MTTLSDTVRSIVSPPPDPSDDGGQFAINLSRTERVGSLVVGGLLAAYGLAKRSPAGVLIAAVGGYVAIRGATGHCHTYHALGLSTADRDKLSDAGTFNRRGVHVSVSFSINKPRAELYRFWRDFQNLPSFMKHLQAVTVIDEKRSHWVTEGPAGVNVSWDAEIISDVPDETIAWRSLAGGDVDNAGSVRFVDGPPGRGTEVKVVLDYVPPAGRFGAAVATLFGRGGGAEVREDLRRFKQLMEAGEIATNGGQPLVACN